MFNFLKDKLKSAFSIFSKKVEESPAETPVETPVEAPVEVPAEVPPRKPPIEEPRAPPASEQPAVAQPEPQQPQPLVPFEIKSQATQAEIKPITTREVKLVEVKKTPTPKPVPKTHEPPVAPPASLPTPLPVKTPVPVPLKIEPQHIEPPAALKPALSVTPPTEEQVVKAQEEAKKKGWFGAITEAITTKKITEEQFNELFWDVELAMLENNVAVQVIDKIKTDLRTTVVGKPLPRTKVSETVMNTLKASLNGLFVDSGYSLLTEAKQHKPFVIAFVGINGSGKTTTIAKVAQLLKKNGLSVVMAAADTFRAAAIDQLQIHADSLGCKLIKHDYGADPAAVAFDAIEHAKAKDKDVVLIDTAGRLHSNTNLIDEMKKIIRVAKPHLKIFIGESITGNDCVEQACTFDNAIGIDGIILSKADIDDKGGAALSISYVTKKPILYLGVGQAYDDLRAFDKNQLLAQIGV
ncbi:signal recognition particle-docking protein FtsY [Candidatus Woesearchaeota archaeon]|nr:signal recognition particle-docking protein FtsY [Candidatus Woesearchaeota archaeon]